MDRRADLHGVRAAQQRLHGRFAVVHARRYGDVELRHGRRAERHAAQDVAQFGRLAERIAVHEGHALHVDIGFEEAVEHHHAAGAARQQRIGHGQHVGQAHGKLHRHGNLHGLGHAAYDVGVLLFQLLRRTVTVGRLQEDVQLQRRGAGLLHRDGIVGPRFGRSDAVDAGDDGHARRARIGDKFEEFTLVGIADITFEVLARIAHALLRRIVEGRGMADDLLLEDRLEDHGARTVAHALFDVGHRGRIGRTADHDGTRKVESEVFCFHKKSFL